MRDLLRHSVLMLRNPRLVALHLAGNAVLLVAASLWLLIPEEHVWQLLFSAVSVLVIAGAFAWMHSGTIVYGAEPAPEKLRAALTPKIGRLAWMLVGALILFWCMSVVDGWSDSTWQISGCIYSKMPASLRPTAGDSVYYTWLGHLFTIVYWYVLPCLFLPVIAARVTGSGVRQGLRTLSRWQYWLTMGGTTIAGVWVTELILSWTPGTSLGVQTVSLVIRLVLAYAIATAAWLVTAGLLGYFVAPRNESATADLAGKAAA